MHTTGTSKWDRDLFRETIKEVVDSTGLTQNEIGKAAGRDRSQVNRWTRADNQPNYDAMQRLASYLAPRFPDLARRLLIAAGYGDAPAQVEAPSPALAEEPPEEELSPPPDDLDMDQPGAWEIWQIPTLSVQERVGLIGVLRSFRHLSSTEKSAEVREFRKRG